MIKPAEERSIIVNTVEANPNVQVTCMLVCHTCISVIRGIKKCQWLVGG